MNYFNHSYVSKSNLVDLKRKLDPNSTQPENLEQIFDLGTLIDVTLLEPHLANVDHKDYELAKTMANAIFKDRLLRDLIMMPDFKRKWEFYRNDLFGLPARCQTDGVSKMISTIFEYKGLSVTSDKQFDEAIYTFDYDLGAAWYLETSKLKYTIIGAASKKQPDKVFKRLVDRDHKIYKRGILKAEVLTTAWKDFFGDKARGILINESE
jgi:hypothetical protein